jgi:hypothetical protein
MSVELSALVPFDPPATRTWPPVKTPVGKSVAVWPQRGDVMLPVVDQLPGPKPGSKITALASVVVPFLPPANRILPPGNVSAVCPSRGLGIDANVLNADCAGSNKKAEEMVDVPLLPPASKTLLLSWEFVVWISVAVPERQPGGGIAPVVAVHVPVPEAGL